MQQSDKQFLTIADQGALYLETGLRALGYNGFPAITPVWLDGRVDLDRMRLALSRLKQKYPVVTSRLNDKKWGKEFWEFRPEADCSFEETTLETGDETEVHLEAEKAIAKPLDPTVSPPVSFHLLRAPQHDVFMVRYNHAVMEPWSVRPLLEELDRLSDESTDPDLTPQPQLEDPIRAYLSRYSRWRRWRAAFRMARDRRPMMGRRAVSLASHSPEPADVVPPRFTARTLDREWKERFFANVAGAGGVPNVSMALMASLFRTVAKFTPCEVGAEDLFMSSVARDLPIKHRPIFENRAHLIPLTVRLHDLKDKNQLLRLLNRQLKQRFRDDLILGALQMLAVTNFRGPYFQRLIRKSIRSILSFAYGYVGPVFGDGSCLCAVPIKHAYHLTQCWTPPGISVGVTECGDHLHLTAAYCTDAISAARAEEFLDSLIEDLAGDAAGAQP